MRGPGDRFRTTGPRCHFPTYCVSAKPARQHRGRAYRFRQNQSRETVFFASTGIGTTPHLTGEMLKRMAAIDFATVSRQCTSSQVGAVNEVIDNTTSIVPQARAGSVRALGISTLTRWPLAPDFAPIADTVPGFAALAFSGVAVRSGTPAEICDSIEAAVKAVCKDPVLIERMTPLLAEVVGSGAKEFGEFIAAERANGENVHRPQNPCRRLASSLCLRGIPLPPTQAYASQALRVTAMARSPPPKANAPFRLSSVRGTEPEKYSQPGPIGPPTLRGAACHAKMAAAPPAKVSP